MQAKSSQQEWITHVINFSRQWTNTRGGVVFWRKSRYLVFFLCLCLLLELSQQQQHAQDSSEPHNNYDGVDYNTLATWVRDNGGTVDNRITLSTIHVDDDTKYRGMIALEDIPKDTTLVGIPFKLILGFVDRTDSHCGVLPIIEREIRLGKSSFWYPYLALLLQQLDKDDHSPKEGSCRIPNFWHSAALQELPQSIFSPTREEATTHTHWAQEGCGFPFIQQPRTIDHNEIMDVVKYQALTLDITRSCDRGLVPIYDLFNHHNGELSTRITANRDDKVFYVIASRFIPKGMEIFNTYGAHGSSQIFRDYGFLEPWPQIWDWDELIQERNGRTTTQVNKFMMLPRPDDHEDISKEDYDLVTIAIDPSEALTQHIGQRYIPLKEYREKVRIHNMEVLSEEDLEDFYDAAEKFLVDTEGVSSIQDDERFLNILYRSASETSNNNMDDVTFLKDMVCAIEYRLEFKRAVKKALMAASSILKTRKRWRHRTEL